MENPGHDVIHNKNRSQQEQEALEVAEGSREKTWKSKSFLAAIFMGDFDFNLCFPYPYQNEKEKKIGDDICQQIDEWAQVHLDGQKIDAEEKIPDHVYAGLHKLGLFAIKIPKKYGGLGLSQKNYMRILSTVAKYCISTAVLLSAHQSIGVPQPLKLFGSEAQKDKYLPRIAAGEITAFALTEYEVGSDPGNLSTEATISKDKSHWVLNGTKLWCTNGVVADLYIVMAKTPDKVINNKKIKQISAFIVEAKWEGVEVLHRCQFMGLKGIENGVIKFNNVKVPLENVVGKTGEGLKLALSTLNDGRLSIPAMSSSGSLAIAHFSNQWANTRIQWGRKIGLHEPGADKLSYINGAAYAMDTFANYCAQLSDTKNVDIRMEAAASKLWATEEFWNIIDLAIQLRGGRGFETQTSLEQRGEASFPLERCLRDVRVNRILEGSSDIMHLFLAREALDPHFTKAGVLLKKTSLVNKVKALIKCVLFYPYWYISLWLGIILSFFKTYDEVSNSIQPHLKWINRHAKVLARTLFHQMILKGAQLEFKQLILSRIVDIGIELSIMGLVAARMETDRINKHQDAEKNFKIGLYWLKMRKNYIKNCFKEIHSNHDHDAMSLAKYLLHEAQPLPKKEDKLSTPLKRKFGKDLTNPTSYTDSV